MVTLRWLCVKGITRTLRVWWNYDGLKTSRVFSAALTRAMNSFVFTSHRPSTTVSTAICIASVASPSSISTRSDFPSCAMPTAQRRLNRRGSLYIGPKGEPSSAMLKPRPCESIFSPLQRLVTQFCRRAHLRNPTCTKTLRLGPHRGSSDPGG